MKEVFLNALRRTFSNKFWNFLGGSIGSILALLLFGKNFFGQNIENSVFLGFLLLLVLYFIRFSYFVALGIYHFARFKSFESIYGDAIIFLKDAFAQIHHIRKKNEISDEEFIQVMSVMCENIKKIFDRKTNSLCSVSVKVAIETTVNANTEVVNLSRDYGSTIRDTENYKKVRHYIFQNTCYNFILSNLLKNKDDKKYYVNNNIPAANDYQNTSKDAYPDGVLPYKSEIVVPIVPLINDFERKFTLVGFLCVDCINTDVFDEKYDLAILQGVADGIYDVILLRNAMKYMNKNKN